MLSDTDMYMLCESHVIAAEFSESFFAVMTLDMKIWIFHRHDLTLLRVYD